MCLSGLVKTLQASCLPSLRTAAGASSVAAAPAATCRKRCGLQQLLPPWLPIAPLPHGGLLGAAADVTGLHILNDRRRQSAMPLGSAA